LDLDPFYLVVNHPSFYDSEWVLFSEINPLFRTVMSFMIVANTQVKINIVALVLSSFFDFLILNVQKLRNPCD
jgi:ABC-type polysaccharide transport system permease subunit